VLVYVIKFKPWKNKSKETNKHDNKIQDDDKPKKQRVSLRDSIRAMQKNANTGDKFNVEIGIIKADKEEHNDTTSNKKSIKSNNNSSKWPSELPEKDDEEEEVEKEKEVKKPIKEREKNALPKKNNKAATSAKWPALLPEDEDDDEEEEKEKEKPKLNEKISGKSDSPKKTVKTSVEKKEEPSSSIPIVTKKKK